MSARETLSLLGFATSGGYARRYLPDGRRVELRSGEFWTGGVLVDVLTSRGGRLTWWRRDLDSAVDVLIKEVI